MFCSAMLTDVDAVSDVALLLMPIMLAVGCYRRQRSKRRSRQPQSTDAASNTTNTTSHTDDFSECQCQSNMSCCMCTIILYRPILDKNLQMAASQPRNSTLDRTRTIRNYHTDLL